MGDLTKDQPLRAETRVVWRGAAMVGSMFAVLGLYQPASSSESGLTPQAQRVAQSVAQDAADAPTFSNEVVRVLQQSCQRCHQDGGVGPMPLETYEQARAWAPMIREKVIRRIMPPWYLDPTIGIQEYKNDYSLSEEEIETLVSWVDAGALEGDPSQLPPPVDWPTWEEWELEARLGPPDLVFETGPIPIRADGQDFWPSINVDWPALDEPRFLKAAEIKNTVQGRGALHHNNVSLNLANGPSGRVVGAGAGKRWDYFGEDTGIRFGTGPGRINFGAHYFPIGEKFEDNIEVAFWFHPEDDPPETEANVEIHHLVDQFDPSQPRGRDILIPPHGTQTMYRTWVLDQPIMINSFRGHMHLHGIAMSIEVIWPGRVPDYYGPGANRRDVIASINNYNHNWQTSFVLEDDARPLLPRGTALVMRTHFDNTENNPLSIDPDQWVVFGGRSVDAMSHFHISVTYLDDQEYETLLGERKLQLAERKERDGSFGTALLSLAPQHRQELDPDAARGRRVGGR